MNQGSDWSKWSRKESHSQNHIIGDKMNLGEFSVELLNSRKCYQIKKRVDLRVGGCINYDVWKNVT